MTEPDDKAGEPSTGAVDRAVGDPSSHPMGNPESRSPLSLLADLAVLFLRLGATAFGGPAAHIAMMEDEVVSRRRWLTREQFLDLLGATNLIPGPNSTEMAIHVGHARAGWPGLLVAGVCFILPATLIVAGLAWVYVHAGRLPQVAGLLYGVKPVVIAIIAQALWRLGRTAIRGRWLGLLAAGAAAANARGMGEIAVLAAAALLAGSAARLAPDHGADPEPPPAGGSAASAARFLPTVSLASGAGATAAGAASAVGLWPLFAFFAKVGSVLFGSGYVLVAFLRSGLVDQRGWLTESQLLDAVAIGQVTPGPLFTTATFIGYVLAGGAGAAAATAGIFLPAFLFVALSGPLVPRLRRSPTAAAMLDGVNAASLSLMAVVTVRLAGAALVDPFTLALGGVSTLVLFRFGASSGWLVAGGAIAGLLVRG